MLSIGAAAAGPEPANPEELPPFNTFAPFWMIREGYRSVVMVNNTVNEDRPFALAVYDQHGRLLSRREHVAPGNGRWRFKCGERAVFGLPRRIRPETEQDQ